MSSALAYPLRLPGWKLAVHLGLSIKTEVLVAFDKNAQKFAARCYDFDRKNPICAEGPDVPSLQTALDEIQAGHAVMLVAVVHSTGSTPRAAGALMLAGFFGMLVGQRFEQERDTERLNAALARHQKSGNR